MDRKRDYTKEWKSIDAPDPFSMRALLRLSINADDQWNPKDNWVRRLFKQSYHPDHVAYCHETSTWNFSASFIKQKNLSLATDKKDCSIASKCEKMFHRRNMPKFAAAVKEGMELIGIDMDAKKLILNAGKRLRRSPFLLELLDCIYRACRVPLSQDAVVGGRDLGGVYTELTMGSALKLTEVLKKLEIISDGCLVQENGSGLNTMACHFAFLYKCHVVGVEIEPERVELGLRSLHQVDGFWHSNQVQARLHKAEYQSSGYLDMEADDKRIKADIVEAKKRLQGLLPRVRTVLADAREVSVQGVTLINSFDEAYNEEDCMTLYCNWAKSPVPYMIAYKLTKKPTLLTKLQDLYPQVKVIEKVKVRKIGMGGNSTATILGKNSSPPVLPFSGTPYQDLSSLDPELAARLQPISSAGWTDPNWITNYRGKVVEPKRFGKAVRLRKQRSGKVVCNSDWFLKCDPSNPGENCNCETALTCLPCTDIMEANSRISGKGLFTKVGISEKQLVVYYTGTLSKDIPADTTYVTYAGGYYIDGKDSGIHKYVNHSCDPNCRLQVMCDVNGDDDGKTVAIVAVKDCKPNDELTIDYGELNRSYFSKNRCNCKSQKCFYENNQLVLFCKILNNDLIGVRGSTPAAPQILEISSRGELQTQDGRDHYRMELLKEFTGSNVYACSIDTQRHLNIDRTRHIDCDVSKTKNFLKNLNALGVRFENVFADWMWCPLDWWREHIQPSFFQVTLPALVREQILKPAAHIFLPFNPWTFAHLAKVGKNKKNQDCLHCQFEAVLLSEDFQNQNALWSSLQACDQHAFQEVFEKGIEDNTRNYLTFTSKSFSELLPPDVDKSVKQLVATIDTKLGIRNIRFIKLTANPRLRNSVFENYL